MNLPVPEWNAGPRWNPAGAPMYLCMGVGVRDIAPEFGAAVMFIQAALAGTEPSETYSADYLVGWSALRVLHEALPKVLRRLERVSKKEGLH